MSDKPDSKSSLRDAIINMDRAQLKTLQKWVGDALPRTIL